MRDSSGEFVTAPLESSRDAAKKPESRTSRVLRFISRNKLGLGAVAAALGIAASGNADNVVHGTEDAVSKVTSLDLSRDNTSEIKNGTIKEISFGKSPDGVEGIVYEKFRLKEVPYSGTVGVATSNQEVIIRSGPTTESDEISFETLKKDGINPDALWGFRVYGEDYDNIPKGQKGEWIEFSYLNKAGEKRTLYTASKFVDFDGEKELRIEQPDGKIIALPYGVDNK